MTATPLLVDTFTNMAGGGNPTAVCLVGDTTTSEVLQSMAQELRVPVTAYVLEPALAEHVYGIRYFTRTTEIPACGHATLAAARIMIDTTNTDRIIFHTSQNLKIEAVSRDGIIWLTYPRYELKPYKPSDDLLRSLNVDAYEPMGICRELDSLFIELRNPTQLRSLQPDYAAMEKADPELKEVVITSVSDDFRYDYLLRSFCPWIGIDEDPVTGSVHSVLAGFWGQRLHKKNLTAYQASARGGVLHLSTGLNEVNLGGQSVLVDQAPI